MKTRIFYFLPLISMAFVLVFSCERQGTNTDPLSISVASDMICKANIPLKSGDPAPENPCIYYNYDGDSLLSMTHYNAGFNCCPESFAVDIEVKGDSLIIREDDAKHGCRCNCIFNLQLKVHNLPAGTYHMRIAESYFNHDWPMLVFDLDLKKKPTGEFCVTRPEGWWN